MKKNRFFIFHDFFFFIFRSFGVHKFIPLDLHVSYHKACGVILSIFSLIHTIVHLINLDVNIVQNTSFNQNNFTYAQYLFSTSPKFLGTLPGYGYPTGFSLFIVLIVMLLGALPVIRRKGFFEMFYFTHLNYILFFILYCLHSPTGLLWFIVPGVCFLLYKLSVFGKLFLGYRSSFAHECVALKVN